MAHQIYKNKLGKRVPSVTTICSRFKESGGLMYWANQQGLDGKTLEEARAPAASAGTFAHDLVEAHANKRAEPDPLGLTEASEQLARQSFKNYLKWQSDTRLKIIHTEVALVSNVHNVGGRLDAMATDESERLALLDWKTGPHYGDHLYQLAGYKILWEENYPDHPITGGFHLCCFAKEQGDFKYNYYDQLDDEAAIFLELRDLYTRMKAVDKRAK